MIAEFIRKTMKVAVYQHNNTSKCGYNRLCGFGILPDYLSISRNSEMTRVERKGRNAFQPAVGQLMGKFKVGEESPLKQHKPFAVRTQLWQVPLYPLFIGYGTIGISGESGKVEGDTGDLVVLYTADEWQTISIFYFPGMGNVNDLEQVMRFLNQYVESGQYEEQKEGAASLLAPSNGLLNDCD